MSMNSGWGAGEMEGSFEALDQQEAYGANGEASYEMERNGLQINPYGEAESQYGEAQQEAEVFDETEEMELASDLLSLGSEAELNQAIGELMQRAAHAVGGSINRDVGMALGSALKSAAQQAVPAAGAPPASSGEVFGIETEGLSGEDQEFEIMRRFVRFAGAAAGRAARAPRGFNPRAIVRSAFTRAARRWAPGLLRRWGGQFGGRGWYGRRWRRWPYFRRQWGVPGPGYPYGYGYPYQPQYPGAPPIPGMEGAQQPAPSFGMGAGPAGVGGAEPSPGAMGQGMPDTGAGPESPGGGGEGPTPQAGRWTRQGGQLIIHL